jgi:hypothetical protein
MIWNRHILVPNFVYIMRKQFQYIKETLFLLYNLKNLVIKVFIHAISYWPYFTNKIMSICPIWNFTLYVTQSLHFFENHPYRKKKMWNQLKCTWYTACVLCIELVIRVDSLLKISHFVDIHVFVSFQLIWPKRLDFVISLRPSLCASVSENFLYFYLILQNTHSIDDVMVSELAWSVVDRELELSHWNNSPRIDMSSHSDTSFWFRANQSLFLLLNAASLVEKQQIPIL